VYLSGTFMGHLLGVTAALSTIDILRDGEVHRNLWRMGDRLSEGINSVVNKLELDARCYNFGSVWCLYFTRKEIENYRDIIHLTSHPQGSPKDHAFRRYLLNNGIYIQPYDVNRAYISAAHSDDDIDKTIEVTADFLTRYQDELR